jgi:uncharacterized protein (TIGR02611 family)
VIDASGVILNAQPERPERPDDEPGLLDEVAGRLGFRDRLKANPALNVAYRIAVAVIGTAIVLLGLFLVPFPGPGWLVVFVGLGILATEFAWAERLLDFARAKVRGWTTWLRRQSLAVRGLLGLGTLAVVAALVLGYVAWQGVPFVGD